MYSVKILFAVFHRGDYESYLFGKQMIKEEEEKRVKNI